MEASGGPPAFPFPPGWLRHEHCSKLVSPSIPSRLPLSLPACIHGPMGPLDTPRSLLWLVLLVLPECIRGGRKRETRGKRLRGEAEELRRLRR